MYNVCPTDNIFAFNCVIHIATIYTEFVLYILCWLCWIKFNSTDRNVEINRNRSVTKETYYSQLVKSLVWKIALYRSESWAVNKCNEKQMTAFELWSSRHVLHISWEVDQIWALEDKKWKTGYGSDREREIEGKCLPCRQRTAWIDDVTWWWATISCQAISMWHVMTDEDRKTF